MRRDFHENEIGPSHGTQRTSQYQGGKELVPQRDKRNVLKMSGPPFERVHECPKVAQSMNHSHPIHIRPWTAWTTLLPL